MWKKHILTTAEPTLDLGFVGQASIYVEGTFGGGTVLIFLKTIDGIVSSAAAYSMDGTTISSTAAPSGLYRITLDGSTGGSVNLWYNERVDLVRTS